MVRSPQSVVRSPQSAVRSPAALHSRSETLYPAALRRYMLQGYNKSILISEKTFRSFLWKCLGHDTGKLWIAVGVTFPPETARRRHGTFTTRLPPSSLQSRHFRFYSPLPWQVILDGWQFLFFINRKIKKRFSFWISPALFLFAAVSLHMKLLCQVWIFNKIEFRE